jgi:hypothetical protein
MAERVQDRAVKDLKKPNTREEKYKMTWQE